jgi:hypothetical protein
MIMISLTLFYTALTMMTGLVSQGKPKEVEKEAGHRS